MAGSAEDFQYGVGEYCVKKYYLAIPGAPGLPEVNVCAVRLVEGNFSSVSSRILCVLNDCPVAKDLFTEARMESNLRFAQGFAKKNAVAVRQMGYDPKTGEYLPK